MDPEDVEELKYKFAKDLLPGDIFLHNNLSRWQVLELPTSSGSGTTMEVKTKGKKFGAEKTFFFGIWVNLQIESK